MVRIPSDRSPAHPGIVLRKEFLNPLVITQRELADAIRVPYQRVNKIVNEKRGITPSTALRFAKYFGNSPGFWMNLQLRYELYEAKQDEGDEIKHIPTLKSKTATR